MNRFFAYLLLCLVTTTAFGAADEREVPHYVILMDGSASMAARREGALQMVSEIIGTGAGSRFDGGDQFALWHVGASVQPLYVGWRTWQTDQSRDLAARSVVEFERMKLDKSANLDAAILELARLAQTNSNLTAYLITDGNQVIYGTPFDLPISTIFFQHSRELGKVKKPFVLSLFLRDGNFVAWAIDIAESGVQLTVPTLPKRFRKEPPAPVVIAPPKIVTPPPPKPPVKMAPPIIVIHTNKPVVTPPEVPVPKPTPPPPPKVEPAVTTDTAPVAPKIAEAPKLPPPAPPTVTAPAPLPPKKEPDPPVVIPPPAPRETTVPPPAEIEVKVEPKTTPAPAPAISLPVSNPSIVAVTPTNVQTNQPAKKAIAVVNPATPEGGRTLLYMGLVLLVAAIGFFGLIWKRGRSTGSSSLISQGLDREQKP